MPETQKPMEVNVEKEAVANPKNFTTIPNSNSEFCIYTYKAEYETYNQINSKGFFNSAALFLNTGDIIRVFRFDAQKRLTNLLEYVVMTVDRINRIVVVATISNHNLEKKVIGE